MKLNETVVTIQLILAPSAQSSVIYPVFESKNDRYQ